MAITQLSCPACGAPLTITGGAHRLTCGFCSSALEVQGKGDEATLHRLDQVVDSIQQSSDMTQSELRRMQLSQELTALRMQLGQLESEMRAIARGQQTAVSRGQLHVLEQQAGPLQRQIAQLERTLNPDVASEQPDAPRPARTGWRRIGWMLFSWKGRLGRAGFWAGVGLLFLFMLIAGALAPVDAQGEIQPGLLFSLATLLYAWGLVALAIKRLHDRDKAGWWVLIGLIPVVGPLYLLFQLGFLPGTPGPNRYG